VKSQFTELLDAEGVAAMNKNVLDAIRDGDWFFEPDDVDPRNYRATTAVPGTREKLHILAERAQAGLPLWHRSDRADYEELETE
jgi:hypothetical protein